MRRLLLALAVAVLLEAPAGAHAVSITEFPLPVTGSSPGHPTVAADGSVWYGAGQTRLRSPAFAHLGRIDPVTLEVRTVALPHSPVDLEHAGRGNAIWATTSHSRPGRLMRLDLAGRTIDVFDTAGSYSKLAATPDGRLFGHRYEHTPEGGTTIDEIDTATGESRVVARVRPLDGPDGRPLLVGYASFLSAATDGGLWAVEGRTDGRVSDQDLIRIDPATGEQRRFALPRDEYVIALAGGAGDEAYASTLLTGERAESAGPRPAARLYRASGPGPVAAPVDVDLRGTTPPTELTVGADRRLWFNTGPGIARLDPATRSVTYDVPPSGGVGALAAGRDGTMWAIQAANGNAVRIRLDHAPDVGNVDSVLDARSGLHSLKACASACRGAVTLELPGRGRPVVAGRATFALPGAGRVRIRVKVAGRVARILRTRGETRVVERTRVRAGGRTRSYARSLTLRRYGAR